MKEGIRIHKAYVRNALDKIGKGHLGPSCIESVFQLSNYIEAVKIIPTKDYIRPWGASVSYKRFVYAFYRTWEELSQLHLRQFLQDKIKPEELDKVLDVNFFI